MSLREDLLPVFRVAARQLVQDLGFRTSRSIIRTRTWSGGAVGKGTPTVSDLELLPRPKLIEDGQRSITLTKITPSHSTGGYTVAQLNPALTAGVESYVVTIGPDSVERRWAVVELSKARNFTYELKLAALTRAIPF